jgi:two-component system cell cycle response regulator CtrA
MRVLLARALATKNSIMAAVYRDLGRDEPSDKTLDVFVCQMRRKLRPHGIEIRTRFGVGWFLDDAMRERLNKTLVRKGAAS